VSCAEDPLARAQRITAELRAATTDAAGMLKDLQKATKAAREQVEDYYAVKVKGALDAHTERWDRELVERFRVMTEDVNRAAMRSRDKAEAAIDTAVAIQEAAEALAVLIAEHTRRTPAGTHIHYGDLINPHSIDLNKAR
jgi:hypothetical protein